MGFLIMQAADGLPAYYSPTAGRAAGATHGWTENKDRALHFLRRVDAQEFLDIFLPHASAFSEVQAHEIGAP